jgi:hypothetical protein
MAGECGVDRGSQARRDGEDGGEGRTGCLWRGVLLNSLDVEGEWEFLWNDAGESDAI